MLPSIKKYCDALVTSFATIEPKRKVLLEKIAAYIKTRTAENKNVNLVYICTHNARRSHFGQVWGKTAAAYYGIKNIHTFSGGTEITQMHPNVVAALQRVGFEIQVLKPGNNPTYSIRYSTSEESITAFSKLFDDVANPQEEFAAIMVCGDAEENCPFVPGVDLRVLTSYDDPKAFDNTPLQNEKYDERCKQIALESLYIFSVVHAILK